MEDDARSPSPRSPDRGARIPPPSSGATMSPSTQTAAPARERNDHRQLKRGAIGVVGILFFVLSAQAPLTGIGGALPLAVALGNGAGAPAAYLVVGLIIVIFAVGFIAMSRHVTAEGAFGAYIGRGLGRRLAPVRHCWPCGPTTR